ncbi:arsenate reductase [Bacillus sp. OV194]|nr:arsenate reductase [Bacillus sp. OV194]
MTKTLNKNRQQLSSTNGYGDAADKYPMTPPVKRDHWGFDNPAKAKRTKEEKWKFFQRVRDEIGDRIETFAKTGE